MRLVVNHVPTRRYPCAKLMRKPVCTCPPPFSPPYVLFPVWSRDPSGLSIEKFYFRQNMDQEDLDWCWAVLSQLPTTVAAIKADYVEQFLEYVKQAAAERLTSLEASKLLHRLVGVEKVRAVR